MPGPASQRYPTRQYAYSRRARGGLESTAAPVVLEPGHVYRFILGLDDATRVLSTAEIAAELADPFARFVLGRGALPLTLNALSAELARANGDPEGLPEERVFVVSDGGQIPWSDETAGIERSFRFLVVRSRPPAQPTLFVSTSGAFDSEETFLQVVAWDERRGAYQFYDRRQGSWIWAGSSWHAFEPGARGEGPFDSHVNGALNMKELKAPWIHWHSMAAGIQDDVLAPDDPLRQEHRWRARSGAERLEIEVIRPGIERWTEARFRACEEGGRLTRLPEFMRQVLETTTANLVSSDQESRTLAAGKPLRLPLTFFVNSDALVDELGLDPSLDEVPSIDGGWYRDCLATFGVALTDGKTTLPGWDTHFAFVAPEPAFEDLLVLRKLRARGVLSDRMAACLLMVDFTNPVFSRRRAALLRHVPASAGTGAASDFTRAFVDAASAAAGPGSAESEFLANWALGDGAWRSEFESRLGAFFEAVRQSLESAQGFARLFELAESRRREFRRQPLAEFRLTTPLTNIPDDAPPLEMTAEGIVRAKPEP